MAGKILRTCFGASAWAVERLGLYIYERVTRPKPTCPVCLASVDPHEGFHYRGSLWHQGCVGYHRGP